MKKTGTNPLDLFLLSKWARAGQLMKQVERCHPYKNRDKEDCGKGDQ
jgi:hypothetical protein